jgi:hypothetical protein
VSYFLFFWWVTHFLAKLKVSIFAFLHGLTPWFESKLLLMVLPFISSIYWVHEFCWSVLVAYPLATPKFVDYINIFLVQTDFLMRKWRKRKSLEIIGMGLGVDYTKTCT